MFSFDSFLFFIFLLVKFELSDIRSRSLKTSSFSELTFITLITAVHPLDVLCRYRCFSEGKEVGTEELEKKEEEQELPECLQLHQMVVRKIGEMCRVVNQVVTTAPEAASWSSFIASETQKIEGMLIFHRQNNQVCLAKIFLSLSVLSMSRNCQYLLIISAAWSVSCTRTIVLIDWNTKLS